MTSRMKAIKECWMRDFGYSDYLNYCLQTRSITVSEYAYNKQCEFYEWEMMESFRENV